MSNTLRNWQPVEVESLPIAPDFYGADSDRDTTIYSTQGDGKIREFRDSVPYKPGDVVWLQDGDKAVRALIRIVHFELDRYGDRRAKFQIQKETKSGLFSKSFSYTWPGYIERGYKKARENAA